ncbi:transketolase [Thermosporothrix hazakensis]|jgi:transketolase|uniref:Transketolase n=2 Tax=Thermosporothrix TaxID=768650 RepID=A0A326UDR2_THEHA|nr:transketolase [Thermosporothrix hazakensis]PZW36426.1 transketolase [Thermosporothrix hazakensis]BBH88893.1 transketolase [Thermosporothrix sp. COM3]GCE47078.1 transketolase [Thermosporothrix hazakensis]
MTIQQEKPTHSQSSLEDLCINAIRTLSMDGVQQANSGHPGTAMALAPLTYLLWTKYMRHNPRNPKWVNRDRFILSCGHASILLYSMLYLTGYDLSLEDIKNFRQWGSKTPGHPEYGHTAGVETTTGPLGQGVANGVGMAIAARFQASRYNKPEHQILDHYIYGICSDGDLMEGIASEAASLAGTLKLGNLIYFYDDNNITIEGDTAIAFTEDVAARFEAYHWHVQRVEDINDLAALDKAIQAAQAEKERPSLIVVRTKIAYGSPNLQGHHKAHGAPLGAEEVVLTKRNLNWPSEEPFFVPEEALNYFRQCVERGAEQEKAWQEQFNAYAAAYPELAEQWQQEQAGKLPHGWDSELPEFPAGEALASRVASGKALNAIAPKLPNLIGGSADLAPSNNTDMKGLGDFGPETNGRNMHYGVREHAMGAIVNGMALYGGLIPFGATFLIFSDYMKASIRLSALMGLKSIFVFTHDSIGVGEDGPTHEPIEQLASLRSIPGLTVIRPADANETVEAWRAAISIDGPVALALTRQNLPTLDRNELASAKNLTRGAYVLLDSEKTPDLILMATGSEVSLAVDAARKLQQEGVAVRVVSMPSWELFEKQDAAYKESVLPKNVRARLAIEAASSFGWARYVGLDGATVTIDQFGASAPAKLLFQHFGFTVDNVVAKAKELLA